MTKYRESELHSSSIYNQNNPWDPPVVFEEFLHNNENIDKEVRAPPSSSPSPRPHLHPVLDLRPVLGSARSFQRGLAGIAHPSPL